MKTLFSCGRGANQKALANKLHAISPLSAIAIIKPLSFNYKYFTLQRLMSVTVGLPFRHAWTKMMAYYDKKFPDFPSIKISNHKDVNADSIFSLISIIKPDLVLISGTNLLKQPLIETILKKGRVINLHTGISPFIKGGPNCTNWCLALGEFNLIGNTVMWIDSGIDSGTIISTEQTLLNGEESISQIHIKVMEHAHDLYLRCFARISNNLPLPNVPQNNLGKGKLFLTKHWTGLQTLRAVINYYRDFKPNNISQKNKYPFVKLD